MLREFSAYTIRSAQSRFRALMSLPHPLRRWQTGNRPPICRSRWHRRTRPPDGWHCKTPLQTPRGRNPTPAFSPAVRSAPARIKSGIAAKPRSGATGTGRGRQARYTPPHGDFLFRFSCSLTFGTPATARGIRLEASRETGNPQSRATVRGRSVCIESSLRVVQNRPRRHSFRQRCR